MVQSIDNSQDLIDSRDVIARIKELEGDLDALTFAVDEAAEGSAEREAAQSELAEWQESDDGEELKALQALADAAEGCADWTFGETLIRDSYFEEYAEQLADDIGAINRNASWPLNCIDWEKAADELKQDYTSVDFDGVDYWIRS